MTAYSHSYHSIKLIPCGAPQRVINRVLSGGSYFLSHALPVLFIRYCHKLCIQRQMVIRWKYVSYLLYGKYLKKNFYSLFTLILHWIKLENFVMQLKRQSVEAWQNGNHYSKENNTSKNPILRREILKPVDHVKYEGQVRSGQVRSQHLLFVQFSRWAFTMSCYLRKLLYITVFFKWVKELLLHNRIEAFFENFHQKWKNASFGA